MSSTVQSTKSEATLLWTLGAFASFAVLFWVIQTSFAKPRELDPREPDRLTNKEEIQSQQKDLISKMGLSDAGKKAIVFEKTLQLLKTRSEATSGQVVPGSPTQLKQAAEPAPTAAPQN